ncbi:MAG TPA: PAS domain S-box protein [Burkholderiaceae bacterium]|nr:PAS domain S-box protein [Burkholderiaceae bacterium]
MFASLHRASAFGLAARWPDWRRSRLGAPPTQRRRSWPVVSVFVCIIAVQVVVAMISIDLLAAVRAYVTGESLYSKGQKDAQIHLLDYAENHREEDYQRFRQALAVPLADRVAREELQKPDPDLAAARDGFLGGGNHADDVDGLIRLFQWFHNVPFMAEAIGTWTEGDLVIEQTQNLVERAHERVVAGDLGAAAVGEMRQRAPILNRRLSALERKFSAQLGDASRRTQRLLLGLNLALAVLLGLTGLAFVRHSSRVQASTEDEVRQRQESLQRLLDSAAEGLYGVDTHGSCTFINRAALSMLGYEHESDLLGRDIHALIRGSPAVGSRYPDRESSLHRACREREELHVDDEVLWRRDGTPIAVEYWSHPVLHDGETHGAVVTFFDITKRLSMQNALRERELGMARLVDAVMDGVITIDEDQRVILFNRAAEQVFGVTAGEAIGSPVDRFMLHLRTEHATSDDSDARSKSLLRELTGVRADGTEFPLEASLSRLQTESGILVTVVLRDVSELVQARAERQAREALEATNRAKTDFLSRMSHELRTPLNAVLGFSQLLRLDAVQPPTPLQLERIVRVENAGAHLLALVNDVLDLSRVDSGQMTLQLESVNLRRVVDDAVAMVSPLSAAAGIELLVPGGPGQSDGAIDAHNACIQADRVRLRQVLVNLLSNAVKYNRAGGRVTVDWASLAGICHLRITDTGPGMTPDCLAHLFEPFNRLGAEKTNVEGTGIGLVLSRRLVELMGGVLQIDSEVGGGTVATLLLESSGKPAVGESVDAPPSQHGALDGHLDVLYAEDNEVNVELVRQVLGFRPAIRLRVAENGTTALVMARENPPDVLLLDMNLGDMTGMELASALRRNVTTRGIRLVALSADALPEQIGAALASGFETYLTKPIDFRKLLNVLDTRAQRCS